MRGFIVALAGFLCALAAQAQAAPPDERKTLGCLVKGGAALQFDAAALQPDAKGLPTYVRLRLLFEHPDRAPAAEVLASTATEGFREAVLAHVAGYRLPCLGERPLAAVQEFQLAPDLLPQGGPLLVVRGPATSDRQCIRKPPSFYYQAEPRVVERLLMEMTYSGDGDSPPTVKVVRSTGGDDFIRAMLKNSEEQRQPCRRASDWPLREEVLVRVSMAGTHPAQFKKQRVPLAEFLSYMKDADDERVFFDLDTMQCPFALRWTLHEPWGRNMVREVEGDNPNRAGLIEWLKNLHSGLKPDSMQQLLGASLLIDVPCGRLNLLPVKR